MMKKPRNLIFTIIGIGKVGSAFCIELKDAGFKIRYLIGRNEKNLKKISAIIGVKHFSTDIEREYLIKSDVIVISVQDKYLNQIVNEIRKKNLSLKTKILFHTSGYSDSSVFKTLDKGRMGIGSYHPLQTFNMLSFRNNHLLQNIFFGIEGNKYAKDLLFSITRKLNSNYVILNSKKKPLYHLACVFSSNFLVSYLDFLNQISAKLSLKPMNRIEIFYPIINETLLNIKKYNTEKSLTGPFIRGDVDVIKGHLLSIKNDFPELLPLYRLLGKNAMKLAVKQNKLSASEKKVLKKLLDLN